MRGSMKGKPGRGTRITYGTYGLIATEPCWIKSNQIEAARVAMGVSTGFEKTLEINGVGYKAVKQGKKLVLSLGYSHPVEMEDPEGIESSVDEKNNITIKGISKEAVGQYAANIRGKRPPEPYKGKGIKYKDEIIRRKVGKTGKK